MGKKPTYSENDVGIIEDAVTFIRKAPSKFIGDDPSGADLTARLVKDLILLDAGPIRAERSASWYSVSADTDWLVSADGYVSLEPFHRMIPMPRGGLFYVRTEVLLTALADAVVTSGADGINWISGEPTHRILPSNLAASSSRRNGRTVSFRFSKTSG
jgi:hypothetical protein